MSKWLWGAVVAIVLVSGCIGQAGVTCDPPNVLINSKCCLDTNSNGICDSDETQTQEPQQTAPTTSCGDGTCSPEEGACSYDSASDRYRTQCTEDCGYVCPAYLYLSSSYLNLGETYSYICEGYSEDVCTKTGNNKFTIQYKTGPYDDELRGIITTVKNAGEEEAQSIKSSFKCYSGGELVIDADKESYKGITVKDYFLDQMILREVLDTLDPVSSEAATSQANPKWYVPYYLHIDMHEMEKGEFDMTCDITLSSQELSWSNTQTLEISFVR